MQEKVFLASDEQYAKCSNVVPLVTWVRQQESVGTNDCIECDLSLVAPWYRDLLTQEGYTSQVAQIDSLADEEASVEEVARVLDEIKSVVTDKRIQQTLTVYDCMMQEYKEVD